jgi:peptidoglycan/LPS O-acetylase OafA/YrhL
VTHSPLLLVDAAINLVLGVALALAPSWLASRLGLPDFGSGFYVSILGAVLFGIGVALCAEWRRRDRGLVGLGLGGAIAINVCGGLCLAGWLLFGSLGIPSRGRVVLWSLTAILLIISAFEWHAHCRRSRQHTADS